MTSAYTWTSYSVMFHHRRGRKCLIPTSPVCRGPPSVVMSRSADAPSHSDTLWHKHLHLRRQRFRPGSLSLSLPVSVSMPAPFVLAQLFLAASGAKNGAFLQRGVTKRSLFERHCSPHPVPFVTKCIFIPNLSLQSQETLSSCLPSLLLRLRTRCQEMLLRRRGRADALALGIATPGVRRGGSACEAGRYAALRMTQQGRSL